MIKPIHIFLLRLWSICTAHAQVPKSTCQGQLNRQGQLLSGPTAKATGSSHPAPSSSCCVQLGAVIIGDSAVISAAGDRPPVNGSVRVDTLAGAGAAWSSGSGSSTIWPRALPPSNRAW